MPQCPKCGKNIDHIDEEVSTHIYTGIRGDSVYTYRCPECMAVLFDDVETADKFINGEVRKKRIIQVAYKIERVIEVEEGADHATISRAIRDDIRTIDSEDYGADNVTWKEDPPDEEHFPEGLDCDEAVRARESMLNEWAIRTGKDQ
jgi:hypothetical protein